MIFVILFLISSMVVGAATAHDRVYCNSWNFWVINLCHGSAWILGVLYEKAQ